MRKIGAIMKNFNYVVLTLTEKEFDFLNSMFDIGKISLPYYILDHYILIIAEDKFDFIYYDNYGSYFLEDKPYYPINEECKNKLVISLQKLEKDFYSAHNEFMLFQKKFIKGR